MAIKSQVIHKRSVSQSLSFLDEKDHKRLEFFYYKLRNEAFVQKKRNRGLKKYSFLFQYVKTTLICMCKCDFTRLKIIHKSKIAALLFNPNIVFPNK